MADIVWRGDLFKKIVEEAAVSGLSDAGEAILTEAIDEAPLLSGTLRRSGTVTVGGEPDAEAIFDAAYGSDGNDGNDQRSTYREPLGNELAVYVSFNTPYAMRQHEDTSLQHPQGGKAKYLEDPYKRNVNKVENLVCSRIEKALRKE